MLILDKIFTEVVCEFKCPILFVTARSRSGLWLQACGNRKRARMQRKIPQMVFQLLT